MKLSLLSSCKRSNCCAVIKDYVAIDANLKDSNENPGQISIRVNITSNPQDNSVTINNEWRGQIDKKTEWMMMYPNSITETESELYYNDGNFNAVRLAYTVVAYDFMNNSYTYIIELTVNSNGETTVWHN